MNKNELGSYIAKQNVNKKTSKELVACAKMINRFDDKMISLKNIKTNQMMTRLSDTSVWASTQHLW